MLTEACQVDNHFPDYDEWDTPCHGVSAKGMKKGRKAAKEGHLAANEPLEDGIAEAVYRPKDVCEDDSLARGPGTRHHCSANEPLQPLEDAVGLKKHTSFFGKVKKLFKRMKKGNKDGEPRKDAHPGGLAEEMNSPFTSLTPGPRSVGSGCGPTESTNHSPSDHVAGR